MSVVCVSQFYRVFFYSRHSLKKTIYFSSLCVCFLFLPPYRVKVYRHRSPLLLSAELDRLSDPSHGRGPRSHVRGQQRLYPLAGSARHQQGAAHSKKRHAPTVVIAPHTSLHVSSLSISPRQIHWPVAPQRKTECVLSGKDTNVSIPIMGYEIKSSAASQIDLLHLSVLYDCIGKCFFRLLIRFKKMSILKMSHWGQGDCAQFFFFFCFF